MRKKPGKLRIELVDVFGTRIADEVEIRLRQWGSRRVTLRKDYSAKKPFVIDDLTPHQTYELQIKPKSYRRAAQLVVLESKVKKVRVVLPIKPNRAVAQLPDFAGLKKHKPDLADILERSPGVKGNTGKTGAALWDALNPLQKASVLNISTRALKTRLEGNQRVLPAVTLTKVEKDRCLVDVPEALVTGIESASEKDFRSVDPTLHTPPENYERRSSYKSHEDFGNIQFTFFQSPTGDAFAADIDIDNSSGFRHVLDVIKHTVTGKGTHPLDIHEILVYHLEDDPGYTLAPKPS